MVFDEIRNYLGQQNFALTATNVPELCVLRNQHAGRAVFVVLIDNTRYSVFNAGHISSVQSQLENISSANSFYGCDTLFIIITNNLNRDGALAQVQGAGVWLADVTSSRLVIYENQPYDFYGMRYGIEACIAPKAGDPMFEGIERGPAGQPSQSGQPGFARRISRLPYVAIILIAVNVIWYIVLAAMGNTSSSTFMVKMGGNVSYLVFEEFQIWRLFTSMFMHFGILHLVSNMFYLGFIGYNIEVGIGHLRFFLIYMLSGLGAGVVSAAYYQLIGQPTVSAGASGAIYGLIGTMMYLIVRNRGTMSRGQTFLRVGIALVFIFYSSILNTTVDGAAHIGGFIFGIILSILFLGRRRK